MLVGKGDMFGVGRPGGVVVVAGVGAEVDDGGGLEAGLVAEEELVLAGLIGEVGDGFAVGAPGGVALGGAGGVGEVAGVSFFRGDGEDLAVGLENGAGAGGGECGVFDFVGADSGEMGREVGELAVDLDGDGFVSAGGGVDEVDGAELLIDDAAGARLEGFEIEAMIGLDLGDGFGGDVVAEEGDGPRPLTAAVGEEVDGVADPDGVGVVGVVAGDFDEVEGLEIDDPDGGGLAAVVLLPCLLPFGDGLVGDGLVVGREGALLAHGQGEGLRHSGAVGRDEEEHEEMAVAGLTAGDEDVFAVGGPAHDLAARGVPGDAAGNAAVGGNDVDVGVAEQVGGVGDLGAVGGVERSGHDMAVGGEALRCPALAADGPDVVGVDEGNVVPRERGIAEQEGLIGGSGLGKGKGGKGGRQRTQNQGHAGESGLHRASIRILGRMRTGLLVAGMGELGTQKVSYAGGVGAVQKKRRGRGRSFCVELSFLAGCC